MSALETAAELGLAEAGGAGLRQARLVCPDAWERLAPGLSGAAQAWLAAQGFAPKTGRIARLPDAAGLPGDLLVGADAAADPWAWAALAAQAPPGDWLAAPGPAPAAAGAAVLGWALGRYRFAVEGAAPASRLIVPDLAGHADTLAEAASVRWARRLIDRPANDAGPEAIEAALGAVVAPFGAEVAVIRGTEALIAAGFPAVAAVGRAAAEAPRLVDIRWGPADAPRVTLVGKGVSFDTGGLTMKSAAGMRQMKRDMGGAAVMGGLAALLMAWGCRLRLRLLVPVVENAVDGTAFRPGDHLRMRSGATVEIENTDCEGRLILADALTAALEDDPDILIDCGTLTGSARTALGGQLQALFSTDDALAAALMAAGARLDDPLWRMPLWQGYAGRIRARNGALLNMAPGAYAGAITAALFLQVFAAPARSWTHLDISAWNDEDRPGRPAGAEATGLRAMAAALRSLAQAGPS